MLPSTQPNPLRLTEHVESRRNGDASGRVGPGAAPVTQWDWGELVAAADLSNNQKLVLFVLLQHADWKHGDSITVSAASVARKASLCERTVVTLLKGLESWGIIEIVNRSLGGRGRTHERRLVAEALHRRAALRQCAPGVAETGEVVCKPEHATLQKRSANPASIADKPIQRTSRITPPTKPPAHERGGGGSAGGGGHSEGVPPEPENPEVDRQESLSLLRGFGVSEKASRELAASHTSGEVREGIKYVSGCPGARTPAGLLVTLLRNGTIRARAADAAASLRARRERERDIRRLEAIKSLMKEASRQAPSDPTGQVQEGLDEVRRAWRTDVEILRSGVLPDDLLLENADWRGAFTALREHAIPKIQSPDPKKAPAPGCVPPLLSQVPSLDHASSNGGETCRAEQRREWAPGNLRRAFDLVVAERRSDRAALSVAAGSPAQCAADPAAITRIESPRSETTAPPADPSRASAAHPMADGQPPHECGHDASVGAEVTRDAAPKLERPAEVSSHRVVPSGDSASPSTPTLERRARAPPLEPSASRSVAGGEGGSNL